jgi:signal transduction histidine kinase
MLLILLAVLVACEFTIGFLVFLQSLQSKRTDQRLFSAISLTTLLWTVANTVLLAVDTAAASDRTYFTIVNGIAFFLASLILTLLYALGFFYPIRKRINNVQSAIIGAGAGLTLLSPTPYIAGYFTSPDDSRLVYHYSPTVLIIIIFAILVVSTLYTGIWRILHGHREKILRRQALTLLMGVTFMVLHAVLFIVVLPAFLGQNTYFYAIGYAAPIYLITFAGYGLLKQGLFDIRLIVARSFAYFLLLTIVSVLYVVPAILIATYVLDDDNLSASTVALMGLLTLIIATFFQSLKLYFNKLTSRLFFRDYYEPQNVLDQLSSVLVGTVDAEEIKTQSTAILEDALRPTSLEFLLFADAREAERKLLRAFQDRPETIIDIDATEHAAHDRYDELKRTGASLAVRLRTSHEELGFMILGFKKSGAAYSAPDKKLLGLIADQLAIGLQNALRFDEIERFNETLQHKIDTATRKLRHTNEKLRMLDQTKDDFISMASHQLRTPLTSVKGYVSMVLDGDAGKLTHLQRKLLNQSFISAQRMVYLISDLLNVSRLRTGKFIIEPVLTNLAKVIKDEVDQLQETARSRNLELVLERPEHFPTLMLDETKMRQVIMNFIDNAIYYTPSGGHITVSLTDRPDSIELTVTDNGIGVPKAEQHHLFTKFFRAHNAKRARPDGTGLGLFMAKKVVVAQGGAIIFKSKEGQGSTFGFTFSKEKLRINSKRVEL